MVLFTITYPVRLSELQGCFLLLHNWCGIAELQR